MDIRRVYVKALSNGFLVERDGHRYEEEEFAFNTYPEVIEWLQANRPVIAPLEDTSQKAIEVAKY